MPEVSVIVPNYNHAQYLPQRLESILNQTFQDFEIILLDDCSTDNSAEILNSYSKNSKVSVFIKNSKNSGSTFSQLRKGLELARGEYIWIAESDDWAQKEFLEITLGKAGKNIGIIYTQSNIVNENGDIQYINTRHTDSIDRKKWNDDFLENGLKAINDYFVYRNVIPNMSATLILKTDLLSATENLDLKYMGDLFIYCQILLTKDLFYIAEPLNNYRQHSNTVRTKALINGLREKEYFFLLGFLKRQHEISMKGIRRQFRVNSKSWLKKAGQISIPMHLRIAMNFIKYVV